MIPDAVELATSLLLMLQLSLKEVLKPALLDSLKLLLPEVLDLKPSVLLPLEPVIP
jgi:hypothetical protein